MKSKNTEAAIISVIVITAFYVAMVIVWKVTALIAVAFNPWIGGGILVALFANKLFS